MCVQGAPPRQRHSVGQRLETLHLNFCSRWRNADQETLFQVIKNDALSLIPIISQLQDRYVSIDS